MKKLTFFILLFIVTGSALRAQDSNTMYLKTDTAGTTTWKDYIKVKKGVMTIFTKGDSSVMTESKTLKDGTLVKPDGTIIYKNNQQVKLREGDGIYFDGTPFKKRAL